MGIIPRVHSRGRWQCLRLAVVFLTFQHGEVHGVVGSLGNTQHHLQAVFDLAFTFLAASEQLLGRRSQAHTVRLEDGQTDGRAGAAERRRTERLTLSSSWYLVILCTGLIR